MNPLTDRGSPRGRRSRSVAASRLLSAPALALLLLACNQSEPEQTATSPSTLPSASPSASVATPQTAEKAQCSALGCKAGRGDFTQMCACKQKPQQSPFQITATNKQHFSKRMGFEVKNTSDKPTHWASVAVYYYDKAGKQLSTKIKDKSYSVARLNGSTFSLKPGETKTLGIGFLKDSLPKGYDAVEVVIDGWCYGEYQDKSSHLCIRNERAPDERPKGG